MDEKMIEKTYKINQEELVLSLIRDTLTSTRLISGLNDIGLGANPFHLESCDTILLIMNIALDDTEYENYLELFEKVVGIDIINEKQELFELAQHIYKHLIQLK